MRFNPLELASGRGPRARGAAATDCDTRVAIWPSVRCAESTAPSCQPGICDEVGAREIDAPVRFVQQAVGRIVQVALLPAALRPRPARAPG